MIQQAYIRYKAYLDSLVQQTFEGHHLNDMGVVSLTLSMIFITGGAWLQMVYSIVIITRDLQAGYISI